MISQTLIQEVQDFAYSQSQKYQVPSIFHIKLSNQKGQELAEKLGANKDVVLLGTLLMDCMLGGAFKKQRMAEHINMSCEKAKKILDKDSGITEEEKENVLACVKQHHGIEKFHSLEAEIVCNVDCYRFLSVKGVIGGIHNGRPMELEDLVILYSKKADEKWRALSLDICKKELEPQYKIIKEFLKGFIL